MSGIAVWAAVAAVIIDSVVTIVVGYRLTKVARKETERAADSLKPVLEKELANAALLLMPIVIEQLKQFFERKETADATTRPIPIISHKPDSNTG